MSHLRAISFHALSPAPACPRSLKLACHGVERLHQFTDLPIGMREALANIQISFPDIPGKRGEFENRRCEAMRQHWDNHQQCEEDSSINTEQHRMTLDKFTFQLVLPEERRH
jgi:hypothetical protein